jgi:hypothetical protein
MVGLLGCGCCQPNDDPVPSGCTVCSATVSNCKADVLPYTDSFSAVDSGWRLLFNWIIPTTTGAHPTSPIDTVPPNTISDYIRGGKCYFFKSPFVTYVEPWFGIGGTRCIPAEPLPSTAEGRQSWLNVIRYANLYFPKSQPRKYVFEITVNYPSNTLPKISTPSSVFNPRHGVYSIFAIGPASMYVWPSSLDYDTDTHASPVLNVGLQLTTSPAFPSWIPSFEQTVTVPFGDVKLRFEYTYQPQTGIGVRSYYVNDVLQRSVSASGFLFSPATSGTDCISACGQIVQLASYEPWRFSQSPPSGPNPLWAWNGFNWLRAGGNAVSPPPYFYTPTWSAANNPADKLAFDNYSMTIVAP